MSEEVKEVPTIEDYFRSVPVEVTELPIFEDENGFWFAHGHVDPLKMVLAINDVDTYNQGKPNEGTIDSNDMQYVYAKISKVDNTSPDWEDEVTFSLCKPSEEGAFPVTMYKT